MIKNIKKQHTAMPQALKDFEPLAEGMAGIDLTDVLATGGKGLKKATKAKLKQFEKEIPAQVRHTLAKLYNNKCAYCEKPTHDPELEHYRPKGGVVGEGKHLGYFWLRYEWTNLLPACHECNKPANKGNHFPLAASGQRVFEPTKKSGVIAFEACKHNKYPLSGEKPLLLHPEYDEPEQELAYDIEGHILGSTEKGKTTVETLGLDRADLLADRLAYVIDAPRKKLEEALLAYRALQGFDASALEMFVEFVFKAIQDHKDDEDRPFSGCARYLFNHFPLLVTPLETTPDEASLIENKWQQLLNAHANPARP